MSHERMQSARRTRPHEPHRRSGMQPRVRVVRDGRPIRLARFAIAAMVVLLAAPACGSGDDSATATTERIGTTEVPPFEETAWGQVLARIGPEGTVDKDTALQAFALAFGDVPGVEVPSGPVGEVVSGSEALRWAVRLRDQLTDPQKEAVDRILAAAADTDE